MTMEVQNTDTDDSQLHLDNKLLMHLIYIIHR